MSSNDIEKGSENASGGYIDRLRSFKPNVRLYLLFVLLTTFNVGIYSVIFNLYILRLGFTGGGPGFLFCFFIALECFFRYAALHYDRDRLTTDVGR